MLGILNLVSAVDNGQDITFKASNYFKSATEVGDLSLDEAEDLIVF